MSDTSKPERIQKILARCGVASRRQIERWIESGQILVNGKVATLGQTLEKDDTVKLNGRYLRWQSHATIAARVIVYNKPLGEVVTRHDPQNRPIVFKQLPKIKEGRWIAVGRLDINTSGLLLFSNNGELANRLMHPSFEIDREYAVRVLGDVNETMINEMKNGVQLEDGLAYFSDVQWTASDRANKWLKVVVKEGKNRLVRRLLESQGVTVSRLIRVRYGPATLPSNTRAQQHYELNAKELAVLQKFVGLT